MKICCIEDWIFHALETVLNYNHTARQLATKKLRIAIVGQPNVGKSSLLNCILGSQRVIVTPVAGTTHDVIDHQVNWEHDGTDAPDHKDNRKERKKRKWLEREKEMQRNQEMAGNVKGTIENGDNTTSAPPTSAPLSTSQDPQIAPLGRVPQHDDKTFIGSSNQNSSTAEAHIRGTTPTTAIVPTAPMTTIAATATEPKQKEIIALTLVDTAGIRRRATHEKGK